MASLPNAARKGFDVARRSAAAACVVAALLAGVAGNDAAAQPRVTCPAQLGAFALLPGNDQGVVSRQGDEARARCDYRVSNRMNDPSWSAMAEFRWVPRDARDVPPAPGFSCSPQADLVNQPGAWNATPTERAVSRNARAYVLWSYSAHTRFQDHARGPLLGFLADQIEPLALPCRAPGAPRAAERVECPARVAGYPLIDEETSRRVRGDGLLVDALRTSDQRGEIVGDGALMAAACRYALPPIPSGPEAYGLLVFRWVPTGASGVPAGDVRFRCHTRYGDSDVLRISPARRGYVEWGEFFLSPLTRGWMSEDRAEDRLSTFTRAATPDAERLLTSEIGRRAAPCDGDDLRSAQAPWPNEGIVGRIVGFTGEPRITKSNGLVVFASLGERLQIGDRIVTAPGTRMRIEIAFDHVIEGRVAATLTIDGGSELVIREVQDALAAQSRRLPLLEVVYGNIHYYGIRTRDAVAGAVLDAALGTAVLIIKAGQALGVIHGTEFVATYDPASDTAEFHLNDGALELRGGGQRRALAASQSVAVVRGAIAPARPLDPALWRSFAPLAGPLAGPRSVPARPAPPGKGESAAAAGTVDITERDLPTLQLPIGPGWVRFDGATFAVQSSPANETWYRLSREAAQQFQLSAMIRVHGGGERRNAALILGASAERGRVAPGDLYVGVGYSGQTVEVHRWDGASWLRIAAAPSAGQAGDRIAVARRSDGYAISVNGQALGAVSAVAPRPDWVWFLVGSGVRADVADWRVERLN